MTPTTYQQMKDVLANEKLSLHVGSGARFHLQKDGTIDSWGINVRPDNTAVIRRPTGVETLAQINFPCSYLRSGKVQFPERYKLGLMDEYPYKDGMVVDFITGVPLEAKKISEMTFDNDKRKKVIKQVQDLTKVLKATVRLQTFEHPHPWRYRGNLNTDKKAAEIVATALDTPAIPKNLFTRLEKELHIRFGQNPTENMEYIEHMMKRARPHLYTLLDVTC